MTPPFVVVSLGSKGNCHRGLVRNIFNIVLNYPPFSPLFLPLTKTLSNLFTIRTIGVGVVPLTPSGQRTIGSGAQFYSLSIPCAGP